jgi:hypothetical protein
VCAKKASATAEKIVQESTRASAVVSRVRALFRKEAQTCELTDMNEVATRRTFCVTKQSGATFPSDFRCQTNCQSSKLIPFKLNKCS